MSVTSKVHDYVKFNLNNIQNYILSSGYPWYPGGKNYQRFLTLPSDRPGLEEAAILTDRQRDRTTYIGETSRNLFTRGKEHQQKYDTENQDSFILKHQNEEHDCQPASFTTKVTGSYRDCLSRQVAEGVAIRRSRNKTLNSKSEWHQPSLWKVRSELERAWVWAGVAKML